MPVGTPSRAIELPPPINVEDEPFRRRAGVLILACAGLAFPVPESLDPNPCPIRRAIRTATSTRTAALFNGRDMSRPSLKPLKIRNDFSKPIIKAFVFAYLSASVSDLFTFLIALARGKTVTKDALAKIVSIVRRHAAIDRFPFCAALIVALSTGMPRLLTFLRPGLRRDHARRAKCDSLRRADSFSRFLGAFTAALLAFSLLNRRPSLPLPSTQSIVVENQSGVNVGINTGIGERARRRSQVAFGSSEPLEALDMPRLAGRTMELTTFGIVHAMVILSAAFLENSSDSRTSEVLRKASEHAVAPASFMVSAFVIMWAFFYSPDRLPSAYNSWIKSAAQIDGRLLEALRQCRFGNFVYGKDTGMSELLSGMARDLGLPEEYGDPAKTIPVPEELYHSGTGKNCEWHAVTRFSKAWLFAMRMYLPLNLLMLLRRASSKRSLGHAFVQASQTSAFLGAFISLFYYGVCCGRCRIGPNILGTDNVSRQMLDGGICIAVGCLACGGSILLEKPPRRAELALFVAARALATILPGRYDRKDIWREQLVFSLSAATIVTAAQTKPERVQGVFGRLLSGIFH